MQTAVTVTHSQLVREAANWLRNTCHCRVVATELRTYISETPDAMGWRSDKSILVECKTSRADFLADAKKPHRYGDGIGNERWFYMPDGLVLAPHVPAGWGLIVREPYGERHICRVVVKAEVRPATLKLAINERVVLVSLAWRALEAVSLVKPFTIMEQES